MEIHSGSRPYRQKGRCTRAIMLLISSLMMISGFAIFGFGIFLYIANSELIAGVNLIGTLLALGFLIFVIASLGFCGAKKRSTICLCMYSCIVFLFIAGEIAVVIVVGAKVIDIDAFLEDRWGELDNDSRVTLQDTFYCCGYPDYEDDIGEPCPSTLEEDIGCKEGFEVAINNFLIEIGVACGLVAFLQIIMLVFGCCLLCTVRKDKKGHL